MSSTTFTVRVNTAVKRRLEKLAKNTGRSRSFLAAEAIENYVNINEWQVAGIKQAIASLDHGHFVSHDEVKNGYLHGDARTNCRCLDDRADENRLVPSGHSRFCGASRL